MRVELRWPLAAPAKAASAAATAVHAPGLGASARAVVLDTNIVLDLLVFTDPATALLRQLLQTGDVRWVATRPMRDELERVLAYPQVAPRVAFYGLSSAAVLQAYDAQVQWVEVPARVPVVCRDADDQQFLDLAAAHQALLLSKDKAVMATRKRLLAHGVLAGTVLAQAAPAATASATA